MNYANEITQDLPHLQLLEKQQIKAQLRDYVRFLRLLKAAANQVNLSLQEAQRLWKCYRQDGLDSLIQTRQNGYMGKLSTTQMSRLRQFLFDDQAQTLADIQSYLAGSLGVNYTIGGVSDLCKRLKIKRKTGRLVNVRQQPGAIEFFKKI